MSGKSNIHLRPFTIKRSLSESDLAVFCALWNLYIFWHCAFEPGLPSPRKSTQAFNLRSTYVSFGHPLCVDLRWLWSGSNFRTKVDARFSPAVWRPNTSRCMRKLIASHLYVAWNLRLFATFCDLRVDLRIRQLATHRKSVRKSWVCKLVSTCVDLRRVRLSPFDQRFRNRLFVSKKSDHICAYSLQEISSCLSWRTASTVLVCIVYSICGWNRPLYDLLVKSTCYADEGWTPSRDFDRNGGVIKAGPPPDNNLDFFSVIGRQHQKFTPKKMLDNSLGSFRLTDPFFSALYQKR